MIKYKNPNLNCLFYLPNTLHHAIHFVLYEYAQQTGSKLHVSLVGRRMSHICLYLQLYHNKFNYEFKKKIVYLSNHTTSLHRVYTETLIFTRLNMSRTQACGFLEVWTF